MEITNAQQNIQNLLNRKLVEFRTVNPSFSMRALAKKIGLQPSATNEILKGQRRISRKVADRIALNLMLDPSERSELLESFPLKLLRNTENSQNREIEMNKVKLNSMQFQAISEPVHYGILSLLRTKNFVSDIDWIALRLGERAQTIEKALKTLIEIDFVTVSKTGEYKRAAGKINTTDDVLSLSIQKSHLQDMEIAKEKLTAVDVSKRDFTSYTLPVDPKLLDKAKEIIRKAQDDIAALMEEGEATEVYKTCTYLYPITKLQ
jgi:uncharacterized protein (TIGR02147 family)